MRGREKQGKGRADRGSGPFLSTGQLLNLVGPPMNIFTLHRLRKAKLISAANDRFDQAPRGKRGNAGNLYWSLGDVVKVKFYSDSLARGIDGRKLHQILRELDVSFGQKQGLDMLASGDAYIVAEPTGRGAQVIYRFSETQINLYSKQILLPLGGLREFVAKVHKLPPPESRVARLRSMKSKAAATG